MVMMEDDGGIIISILVERNVLPIMSPSAHQATHIPQNAPVYTSYLSVPFIFFLILEQIVEQLQVCVFLAVSVKKMFARLYCVCGHHRVCLLIVSRYACIKTI